MKYKHYHALDFIQDPSFLKWVLDKDQESYMYWSEWLQEHPEKEQEVQEAVHLIKTLKLSTDAEKNRAFVEVWQQIDAQTSVNSKPLYKYWHVAACIALVFLSGIVLFTLNLNADTNLYQAKEGTTNYMLPDSSFITLNAGSEVEYTVNEQGDRELWLTGEAYFDVKKMTKLDNRKASKFTVHTKNADIEVLGTAFNLYQDDKKTQLVLTHGKVKLSSKGKDDVYVKPGEFVEVKAEEPSIKKKQVNTEMYTSWTSEKIKFEQTPLAEIAQWIEDRYDKEVIIPRQLDSITFTATIPNVKLSLLLEAIEVAYHVKVEDKEDIILIKNLQ